MTTLYRYFDADGRLLYVGITGHGRSRQAAHVHSSWWSEVATAAYEHMPCREDALRAEVAAIRSEKPLYNRSPGYWPRYQPVHVRDDELIVLP